MAAHLRLDLERSGFVGWQPGAGDWDLVLAPLGLVVNWLTNLLVFRGGWTVHVVDEQSGTTIGKVMVLPSTSPHTPSASAPHPTALARLVLDVRIISRYRADCGMSGR